MNDEIKLIERKFLDPKLRKREDCPAKALTPEERLVYADYLDSINQSLGARVFREYRDEDNSAGKRRQKPPKAQSEGIEAKVYAADGSEIAALTVEKHIQFIKSGERLFIQGKKKTDKKKFFETLTKLHLAEGEKNVHVWS